MSMEKFVSGVGKTNIDILYGGMPRVPREGEEIYSRNFSLQLGGGYPATLINLGRLHVPARIQTYLGNDMFSSFAREQYERIGVQPYNLYEQEGIPVNITSAVITPRDRAFISYSDEVKITDKTLSKVYKASLGASIVLIDERFLPIYPDLKKRGSVLVYDTGYRDDMSEASMKEVLNMADWYTPNAQEAMKITGMNTPLEAAKRLGRYLETPIVKLDMNGCLLLEGGKAVTVPVCPGIHCVDSTGAGDAFLAGFVYGLYHHASATDCVIYGNITGGRSVTEMGCLGAWVSEEELLEQAKFLRQRVRINSIS